MAIKKVKDMTTKILEKDVTFMHDTTVNFVSLVRQGANNESFVVIKEVKGGDEDMPKRIIQRVIVSKNLAENELDKVLKIFKTDDELDYEGYLAYDQIKLDLCNKESIDALKLNKEGTAFAVTATLLDEEVLKEYTEVVEEETLKEASKEAVPWAIKDVIADEMYSMTSIIRGALGQANSKVEWQKSTIKEAIENFNSFVEVIMDNFAELVSTKEAQEAFAKAEKDASIAATTITEVKEKLDELVISIAELKTTGVIKGTKEDIQMEKLFESKKELGEFIASSVDERLRARDKSAEEQARKTAEDNERKELKDSLTTITDSLKKVSDDVDALKGKTPPAGTQVDGGVIPIVVEKKADGEVFGGVFLKGNAGIAS